MGMSRRIMLIALGITLAGSLAFFGLNALRSNSPAAGSADRISPPEAAVMHDAELQLADIGISLEPYRHGVIKPEGATIRTDRNGEHGFGIFFMPAEDTRNWVVRFSATGDARVIIRTTVSG